MSETSRGSHVSGKDMKIGMHDVSNKSCTIEKNKVHISSYRLTSVCNNKDNGNVHDILHEIKKRDSSFQLYSLLCRQEYEHGIHYYWCVIPKTYYVLNAPLQQWKKKYGIRTQKDKVVGWKGEYCDITFSMSSQLWFHFDFCKIKQFVLHDIYIGYTDTTDTLSYSDIYTLYHSNRLCTSSI